MAKFKPDTTIIVSSIAKIGMALLFPDQGFSLGALAVLADVGGDLLSCFSAQKQPDLLRNFQNLIKKSIRETLESHKFVFEVEQIDRVTDAILDPEGLKELMGPNGADLFYAQITNSLDAINYPYKEHGLELEELIETILQKIHAGIANDVNLMALDSNVTVHLIFDILKRLEDKLQPAEGFPHYLTGMEFLDPGSVLHRKTIIDELAGRLNEGQRLSMITGIGGVGKTAVAGAVLKRVDDHFAHVAWINFSGSLDEQLLKFNLYQTGYEPRDRLAKIQLFLRNVAEPVLVVLDDVNQPPSQQDLATLKSFSPSVRLLLTSRLPKIKDFKSYPLDFLADEQCDDLFYLYYDYDEERRYVEIVKNIIAAVHRHSLTIELIARSANHPPRDLPAVWDELQRSGFAYSALEIDSLHDPEPQTLVAHIQKLYNLAVLDEPKRKVMRVFSILPSNSPLPWEIQAWLPCDINDLKFLMDRGWIQHSGLALSIHQMI